MADEISDDEAPLSISSQSDGEEGYDSDLEQLFRLRALEDDVKLRHEQHEARRLERNPILKLKKDREAKKKESAVSSQFEEWYGIQYEEKMKKKEKEDNGEHSGSSDDSDSESDDEKFSGKLEWREN